MALTSPARIAVLGVDKLLVSDYLSNAVYLVDKLTLKLTKKIRVAGQPTGVAFTGDRYFIGNKTLCSVDVHDSQGLFLYRLGRGKGEFLQINDVAVYESVDRNLVYVVDTKAAVVKVFNLDGSNTGVVIGAGKLKKPVALAIDATSGNILVSDFGNPGIPGVLSRDTQQVLPAVQIFSFSGTHIQTINGATIATSGGGMMGGTTSLQTTFSTPQGLYTDNNYLYLVDVLSATIRVYNLTSLALVKTFGIRGTGPDELFYPLDIVVDNITKDVFVTDNRNNRITAFRGEGVAP